MSSRADFFRARPFRISLALAGLVGAVACAYHAGVTLREKHAADFRGIAAASRAAVDGFSLIHSRSEPLRIKPFVPVIALDRDWKSIDKLTKRVWPTKHDWLSVVLHGLLVFEPDCQPPDDKAPDKAPNDAPNDKAPDDKAPRDKAPTWHEMQSVLLDTNVNKGWFDGQVSLVQTREGLRFISTRESVPAASAHIDHCLAALGGMGVSLEHVFYTPTGRGTLRNVLEDSVANFQLDREVEWTAIALTLYLPPQRSWQNKAGEQFNFDMLAKEIMSRQFAEAPCGGTHGLGALTLMYRAHQLEPILSESCHQLVETYLRNCADSVRRSQLDSGAFPGEWYADILHQPWYWDIVEQCENNFPNEVGKLRHLYVNSRRQEGEVDATKSPLTEQELGLDTQTLVQMTGHHLEWFVMLPQEMQPDVTVFQRAAAYSIKSLEEASERELKRGYCPYSHTARMLRLLGHKALAASGSEPVGSTQSPEIDDATAVETTKIGGTKESQ